MEKIENAFVILILVMSLFMIPRYVEIYHEIKFNNNHCRCIDNSLWPPHDRTVMWANLNKLSGKGVMYISEGDYMYFCQSVKVSAF